MYGVCHTRACPIASLHDCARDRIRADRFAYQTIVHRRHPRVGDIGVVLEVYEKPEPAYEVECADPVTGVTAWLEPMYPEEIEASPDESAAS